MYDSGVRMVRCSGCTRTPLGLSLTDGFLTVRLQPVRSFPAHRCLQSCPNDPVYNNSGSVDKEFLKKNTENAVKTKTQHIQSSQAINACVTRWLAPRGTARSHGLGQSPKSRPFFYEAPGGLRDAQNVARRGAFFQTVVCRKKHRGLSVELANVIYRPNGQENTLLLLTPMVLTHAHT